MSTSAILQNADQLVARGHTAEAVALVTRASDAGDVNALFRHAAWLLIGAPLPRDLPGARALLRRAVEIGHVDAALLEAALTANGSGRIADWPAALRLLEAAAGIDPIAAEHLRLVKAMNLAEDGGPAAVPIGEPLAPDGRVVRFASLLTPDECAHVAITASDLLAPASVIDPRTGRGMPHPIRTSDNAVIGPMRESLVVRAINERLAGISGTGIAQGEALTVLRYRPSQQYRLHHDTIAGVPNQRIATVLVYLNQGFGGGETVFPDYGLSIAPRAGDAVVFRNTLPDGRPDPRARHAGLPVTHGAKWLATRWIRAQPVDPWTMSAEAG